MACHYSIEKTFQATKNLRKIIAEANTLEIEMQGGAKYPAFLSVVNVEPKKKMGECFTYEDTCSRRMGG